MGDCRALYLGCLALNCMLKREGCIKDVDREGVMG